MSERPNSVLEPGLTSFQIRLKCRIRHLSWPTVMKDFVKAAPYSGRIKARNRVAEFPQLVRVVEKALCFQDQGRYSDEAYVALVTPEMFKRPDSELRAYQEIFLGYDLDTCRLEKRDRADWKYPVGI